MKPRLSILSVIAGLLIALVSAAAVCGGGDDELKQALESLVENDLAIMVLPQEELGDEFADLEVDEDSGFNNNEEAADDTIDPDDTADDLEAIGRINGYDLTYSDPALLALEAGEGVLSVSTEVDLFEDGGGASDFLAKQVDDFQRLEGEEIEATVTLEEVITFAVDGLADEAIGLRARVNFGEVQFYGTLVAFKLDRLVGAADIGRADDADVNSQVEEMARAIEERLKGVLLGEITGTPEPIPEGEEEEAAGPPPEGVPALAAMALSLDDLPAGVSIDREGYVEDEDTVASYEREFDLGLMRIGSSRFISLENDLDLYEDSVEASIIFTTFEALFTGESAVDFFASALSEGGGFAVTDVRATPADIPDLGDASFGVSVSFGSPLGSFEAVYVFVRVGRVFGSLILTGPAGEVDMADVVPLAEAVTARMEAGLVGAGEATGEEALVPQEAVGVAQSFLEPFGLGGALQSLGGTTAPSLTTGDPLEEMVLSSEDVPPEYEKLFGGSSTFAVDESFGAPSAREVTMAMSMFANESEQQMIMSMVMQAEDEALAEGDLGGISEVDFAEIEQALAVYEVFGIRVTNLRPVDASGLGDGGFGFGFTMDFSALIEELGEALGEEEMEFSTMDMEMLMFVDGPLVAMVMTIGTDDNAPASRPLAEIMAAKVAAIS